MDIRREIAERHEVGQTFIVATIIKTSGSSPREVGARMLVFPDGTVSGTIGGGVFEKMVQEDCLGLLEGTAKHLLKTYRFAASGPDSTGMACGGEADVFMELFAKPDRLLIFGGGHIGKDLVRIAEPLDFRITVIDDRGDVLSQYTKPVETILTDSGYKTNLPTLDGTCYVVIVTRDHSCDRSVLRRVIGAELAYLGMIGSKTKIVETWELLRADGVKESLFRKVRTPIGFDIGAEGPYEIALAIAAELVATKRRRLRGES
jgi:xanthine dehydrogenase accessory factor